VLKDAVNKQANELLRKDLDTTGASLSVLDKVQQRRYP
jgi:hypothetical protein